MCEKNFTQMMSQNDRPFVSVLLPVYNAEKYLKEAIESILSQTFIDFEFIIINDGSTDNSEQIILSYTDQRIRYVKNEKNLKLIATLNKGIRLARGKYIVRMDADDVSLPKRIEKQVRFMEAHPNVGVCGTWFKVFGEIKRPYIVILPEKDWQLKAGLLVSCPFAHPSVIMRKSTLLDNKIFYDERFYRLEDWGLWVSLAKVCDFANIPEVLLDYRWISTSESRMNVKDERHLAVWMKIVECFFINLNIEYSERELKLISAITKFPHIYRINNDILSYTFNVLKIKLEELERKIPQIDNYTYKQIIRFSLRRKCLIPFLLRSIGCGKYFIFIIKNIRDNIKNKLIVKKYELYKCRQ